MSLSIDIGGTFTDFVIVDDDIDHFKKASTPEKPEEAIRVGLEEENVKIAGDVLHGTTVATNAFIEKEGAETAFITNRDFEDIIFIGRQTRPELYELDVEKSKPPLKKENTYGISGRVDHKGNILNTIDKDELRKVAEELKKKELSSAVCLLHSYKNPDQEKEVGKILDEYGINYSLSHQVSNEFREYERGLTTLMDAYLSPVVDRYFQSLKNILKQEPYIMKSGGGLEPSSIVNAVDCLYSGPAGGGAGGAFIAKTIGVSNLVTLDMGGTSADMATIIDGKISWEDEGKIDRFPIKTKMVDLVTVGSGGGSIAKCDEGGALRVGPKSAGAMPGPVCYGRGGVKPTVTDALLLMGYIDEDYFLGGNMRLDIKKARKVLADLSDELKMEFEDTLKGIFRVANSKMARTMKEITVKRGIDTKNFSILAFGGAGPLHGASIAEELDIERVIVPPMAGVFSALGMITGDIVHDNSKTILVSLDEKEKIEEVRQKLKAELKVEGEENTFLGLRYKGQSYHINVPFSGSLKKSAEAFHEKHKKKYGYSNPDEDIEVVRVHVEIRKSRYIGDLSYKFKSGKHPKNRKCLFSDGWHETSIYKRKFLSERKNGEGPSVIEDENSTILVPPGWRWKIGKIGSVILEVT